MKIQLTRNGTYLWMSGLKQNIFAVKILWGFFPKVLPWILEEACPAQKDFQWNLNIKNDCAKILFVY